ncbi:hypothetical protein JIN78_16830 [Roseibacillus ishigakijimensis]|uniref:Uncharacterized protein n=1 Tax=Roseibacillus ishigakijimensis TaxID=454146 RepID=A0A934VP48_9BACT|nr:hypothetical protein [Roseibacillus ishigakijimensis]MBK1835730.1 hypothetical protein [Roseibacillus ishigakijimensis]
MITKAAAASSTPETAMHHALLSIRPPMRHTAAFSRSATATPRPNGASHTSPGQGPGMVAQPSSQQG